MTTHDIMGLCMIGIFIPALLIVGPATMIDGIAWLISGILDGIRVIMGTIADAIADAIQRNKRPVTHEK